MMAEDTLRGVQSLEEFLKGCEEKTSTHNEKTIHTLITFWRLLEILIDKHHLEGLTPQEIIDKLNNSDKQFRSEPTIYKALETLRLWGVIDKIQEKRWIANKSTASLYKRIDDLIPNIHISKDWVREVVDMRYFDDQKMIVKDQPFLFTGSLLLNDSTNIKDFNKLLNSGKVVEFRGTIRPAGTEVKL